MTTGESTATLGKPRSWFLLSTPVGQLPYAAVGFGLALVKYTIEALSVYALTNQFFSPLDFVNPWLSRKAPFLVDAPAAGLLWLLFSAHQFGYEPFSFLPKTWPAVVIRKSRLLHGHYLLEMMARFFRDLSFSMNQAFGRSSSPAPVALATRLIIVQARDLPINVLLESLSVWLGQSSDVAN